VRVTELPAGFDSDNVIFASSVADVTSPKLTEKVDDAEVPTSTASGAAEVTVIASTATSVLVLAALAGTAENPAIANADAATSAIRLKLVFEDMYFFLSKRAGRNFLLAPLITKLGYET